MFSIPWYVVVFQSIPEMMLSIMLGFALYNLVLPIRMVFLVSVPISVVVYFLRQLDIVFGLHTLTAVLLLIIFIRVVSNINLSSILFASLTGVVVLGILQSILVPIIFEIFSITTQDLVAKPWLNILCFIPEALVMIFGYWFIRKRQVFIVDLKERGKNVKSL